VRTLMRSLGAGEVDLEGGPEVLGGLLATGGVDELILTLSPTVALGGDATRLVSSGVAGTERVRVRVADAFTAPDGGLYTRWVVREEAQCPASVRAARSVSSSRDWRSSSQGAPRCRPPARGSPRATGRATGPARAPGRPTAAHRRARRTGWLLT